MDRSWLRVVGCQSSWLLCSARIVRVVLGGLWSECSLKYRFGLSALVSLWIRDDSFMVTIDDGRHHADGAKHLRARDIDAVETVGAARRLANDLRQARPLHQVLVRQLIKVPR